MKKKVVKKKVVKQYDAKSMRRYILMQRCDCFTTRLFL